MKIHEAVEKRSYKYYSILFNLSQKKSSLSEKIAHCHVMTKYFTGDGT